MKKENEEKPKNIEQTKQAKACLTEAEQEEEEAKESFSAGELATINTFLDEEYDIEEADDNITAYVCLVRMFPVEDESPRKLE